MRFFRWSAFLFLFALLICACGNGPVHGPDGGEDCERPARPSGPGESCVNDCDCVEGLRCLDGECRGFDPTGLGDPCLETQDCPEGLICEESHCVMQPLTGEADGRVVLEEIGGEGLTVHSAWDESPAEPGPLGLFRAIRSESGAQRLEVRDGWSARYC